MPIEMMSPNLLHVVVATVAVYLAAWGYFAVLGKLFQKENPPTEAQQKKVKEVGMGKLMAQSSVIELIGTFLATYVVAHFILLLGIADASGKFRVFAAWQLAFWIWLGFKLPSALSQIAWNNKTWRSLVLETQTLLGLVVMTTILTLWK